MFALSDFLARLNKYHGLAKPHLFVVSITPPPALAGKMSAIASDLKFFCDSAALPGISVMTSDVRHYNYGPTERKPYAPVFVDNQMTFMLDNKGEILKFFHTWMQNVIDFNGGRGISGDTVNGVQPYEVHYSSEYVTTITVTQYNQHETEIISYDLLGAYPLTVSEIPTSWTSSNDVMRANVSFTYRSWTSKHLDASKSIRDAGVSGQSDILSLTKDGSINRGASLGLTRQPIIVADIINAVNNTKIF